MPFFTMSYSMPIGYGIDPKTGLWVRLPEYGPIWSGRYEWRNHCVPAGAMVIAGYGPVKGHRQAELVTKVMEAGDIPVAELISDDNIYSAERYRLIKCILNGSLDLMLERYGPLAWDRPACHNTFTGLAPRRDH